MQCIELVQGDMLVQQRLHAESHMQQEAGNAKVQQCIETAGSRQCTGAAVHGGSRQQAEEPGQRQHVRPTVDANISRRFNQRSRKQPKTCNSVIRG